MNAVGVARRRFCQCITLIVTCIFGLIGLGALRNMYLLGRSGFPGKLVPALGALFFSAQLALFIAALFRGIDRVGPDRRRAQRCIAVALHALMLVVFLVFLRAFAKVRPTTDSFDDLETAWYLYKHGTVDRDFVHAKYVAVYGNNYFLILLFARCYQLMDALGIRDALSPFYYVNVLAMMAAVHLTWRFVKETRGICAANRTLALCALNPLYYGLTCWVYSLTLSLPVTMGILYLGLRLRRSRSLPGSVGLGLLLGLLIALGYEVRPTAVFVAIALAIVGTGHVARAGQLRRYAPAILALLLSAALAIAGARMAVERRFRELIPDNYPVTYWLSMGSHDSGRLGTNQEDMDLANAYADGDARSAALARNALGNYRRLGPLGTLSLWLRKTVVTWSDGYSQMDVRLSSGAHDGLLHDYVAGDRSRPFRYACNAYRLVCCLGVCAAGFWALRRRQYRRDMFVCMLTLFGGVAFYMLWEAKSIYSAPFLLFMMIPAQDGIAQTSAALGAVPAGARRAGRIGFCALGLAACFAILPLCGRNALYASSRIDSLSNIRVNRRIPAETRITQSFDVSRPFNRISLLSKSEAGPSAPSAYRLTISDAEGQCLFTRAVTADDIASDVIAVDTGLLPAGEGYRLDIEKEVPGAGALYFYAKPTYLLDLYDGTLETDAMSSFTSDLVMDVDYVARGPWCARRWAAAVVPLYLLFTAAGAVPARRKRRAP